MKTKYWYYSVKCWQPPGETEWGHRKTIGVVARNVEEAIYHTKRLHAGIRVDCVNTGGAVKYFPGQEKISET